MARTASTSRNEVTATVGVFDLVYLVAENRGMMQTQKQLGEVLFQNETEIQKVMKEAAMNYIQPIVFKMAGITAREISDGGATNDSGTIETPAIDPNDFMKVMADNSASLPDTKSLKASKK